MNPTVKITPRITAPAARRPVLAVVQGGARQPGVSVPGVPDGAVSHGTGTTRTQPRRRGPGEAGWWLRGAAAVLALLDGAAAAVSWQAQYVMVLGVKHVPVIAAIEAGIPDAGALVFAALGVAVALHGRRALRPRVLNAACIAISLAMNALDRNSSAVVCTGSLACVPKLDATCSGPASHA